MSPSDPGWGNPFGSMPWSTWSVTTGYTLGQMLEQVRQSLPARSRTFGAPVTGAQGDLVATMVNKVRTGLRDDAPNDADRFIRDADILEWINEAIVQVGDRTHAVRKKKVGVVDGTAFIPLPADFTRIEQLYVAARPVLYVDDDEEWHDVAYDLTDSPPRPLCRVVEDKLEVFPIPVNGLGYELHYACHPYQFLSPTDATKTNVPVALQPRLIHYARANAHWKLRDFSEGDRYMSLFERGLGPGEFEQPTDADKAKPREVQDHEIIAWLNQGALEVAYREECLVRSISGLVDATTGRIPVPEDMLRVKAVRLDVSLSDGSLEVERVTDEVYDSWAFGVGSPTPAHYLARVALPFLDVFPRPAATVTYQLTYAARPAILVELEDKLELPFPLQPNVIAFAKANALASAPLSQLDLARADRFSQTFESGLRPGNTRNQISSGPASMGFEPGPFDLDSGAQHL